MASFTGMYMSVPLRSRAPGISENLLKEQQKSQDMRTAFLGSSPSGNTRVTNLPLETVHGTPGGIRTEALLNTVYGRIHIKPAVIGLGNIVGVQLEDILVWNATFAPVTLQSIAESGTEGVTLTGQADPPLVYGALSERTYEAQITTDGPATLDALYTFNFSDGEVRTLEITGNRLVVFSFYPTWENGITETLEWLTDVLSSPLGDEQRRALRIAPRRQFEVAVVAHGRMRQRMDAFSFGWGGRVWAIPVWNDIQETNAAVAAGAESMLCSTTGYDFADGGLVLFRGADDQDYEIVEITTVTTTGLNFRRPVQRSWPKYTRIYPMRTARWTEQPTATKLTDTATTVSCVFMVTEVSDHAVWVPTESWQGYPVYRVPPEESESLTYTYKRLIESLDTSTNFPLYTDTADMGFSLNGFRWLLSGRAAQQSFRSLLYYLCGQWRGVWIPTHFDDITLIDDYAATGNVLDIAWIGYTKYIQLRPGRRDIMITLLDGTVFFARITSSSETGEDTERLVLDHALGQSFTIGEVYRISFMSLCRLAADSVEIEHQTDSDGVAAIKVVWQGIRDDLD